MMKTINLAVALVAVALAGCDPGPSYKTFPGQQPTTNNDGTRSSTPIPTVQSGYARIPLGEAGADARISTARNFYMILDASGSMAGEKMRMAKTAIYQWLASVPEDANLGLYIFSAAGETDHEFVTLGPNQKEKFRDVIRRIEAGGGTPLGRSMRIGVDALVRQYQRQLGYGEYRLVVVTDGQDNDGEAPVRNAGNYAASVGIPIYSIGLQVSNRGLRDTSLFYVEADNLPALNKGLAETLSESSDFDASDFSK